MLRHRRPLALALVSFTACGSDPEPSGGTTRADATSGTDVVLPTGEVTITPPDVPDVPDVPDAADTADVPAGAFGAACVGNEDCDSGYCVEGPHGFACTRAARLCLHPVVHLRVPRGLRLQGSQRWLRHRLLVRRARRAPERAVQRGLPMRGRRVPARAARARRPRLDDRGLY